MLISRPNCGPKFQTLVIFFDHLIGAGWYFGATAVRNGGEYEANAAECRRLAAQTKNPKQKKQLDDMAEPWDRLARERRQGIVENNPDQT
jgi:hypothetical protein